MSEQLWTWLAARRNHPPRRLVAPGPDAVALERIFEAAAQAPDHGQLRPWRFIVIPAGRRGDLGEVFERALAERDPAADDEARTRARDKAFHSPCLLVAVLDDAPKGTITTAEKLVSLGCAVQNMLTAAQALGYASGLASGAAMNSAGMRELLRLERQEQAICFVAFGSSSAARPPRERPRPEEFVSIL